jgi:hypothetical protein
LLLPESIKTKGIPTGAVGLITAAQAEQIMEKQI